MRIVRIVLMVLGILFILVNALGYVGGARFEQQGSASTSIAYFIGLNSFFILGLLFLFFSWLINRRLKRKADKKMVDSLFNDQEA